MITNSKIIGENVSQDDYRKQNNPRGHKDFVMTRSSLCDFAKCPRKWLRGFASKDTDATDWGTMLDCMVLDNANFLKRFAVIPETYPAPHDHTRVKKHEIPAGYPLKWNGNAGYCEEWKKDREGMQFVSTQDASDAGIAMQRLKDDEAIAEVIEQSRKQVMVSAEWADGATGLTVPVGILIDVVPNENTRVGNSLVDLKSSRDAHPEKWVRDVVAYNLHVQAKFYLDVWNAITGEKKREQFRHIISENVAPFEPAKRWMSDEFMNMGGDFYKRALSQYCQCLATGEWPSFKEQLPIDGWGCTEPTSWMMMQQQRGQL